MAALNNSHTRSEKIRAQAAYTEANKMVKKSTRAEKRAYLDTLPVKAEEAAHRHGNIEKLSTPTQKSSLGHLVSQRDPQKTKMEPRLLEKDKQEMGGILRGAPEQASAKGSSGRPTSLSRPADHLYCAYNRENPKSNHTAQK